MAIAFSSAPDFSASRSVLPPRAGADASNTESWVQGLRIRNARRTSSRPLITPSEVNWQAGYRYSPDPFGTASRARRLRRLSTACRVMLRARATWLDVRPPPPPVNNSRLMAAPRAIASRNGSTAERSTPSGARSDSRDATPPTSVGEDRADFRASDDAEELTRSSIFTDRFKNACARACLALSTGCLPIEGNGVLLALANAAELRLDLIRLLSLEFYHVHRAAEQTRATKATRQNLNSRPLAPQPPRAVQYKPKIFNCLRFNGIAEAD